MHQCHYCEVEGDLRPYGPKGAMICFDCMKASPEREAEAIRQLHAQLDAASKDSSIVMIGTEAGPVPLKGARH